MRVFLGVCSSCWWQLVATWLVCLQFICCAMELSSGYINSLKSR